VTERLKTLREKRAQAVAAMRAITDLGLKEKRDLTGEELVKHQELFGEIDKLRQQIEAEERQIEADRQVAATSTAAVATVPTTDEQRAARQLQGFRGWLRSGAAYMGEGAAEFRDLQAGSLTGGGYLIPPQQFVQQLLKNVDDLVFMRQLATKYTVASAQSLGVPTLDADPADADWTTELAVGNTDSAMVFGKREMVPYPFAKLLKVSKKLLQAATIPVDTLVAQRLAYKFAITEEKGYLLGTGAKQPLGVFTASNDGIPTSRDVSTGNTSTLIKFDGLISAKYSLKAQYQSKAKWMFHRDGVAQIAKLVDNNGQYLWRESVRVGEPDTILNLPYYMSEYVPNTFTTGLYVGIIGDFSQYWIADAIDMQIQRVVELYAATNQDGFIARKETDGMPVLSEAFARVKLG
jgi:HK97 family phage major capsid protein